jgi:hypothetical protein
MNASRPTAFLPTWARRSARFWRSLRWAGRTQSRLRNVDQPARVAGVVISAEINLAQENPPSVIVVPSLQHDPDDGAALLIPLLLGHARRPLRRPCAFEEVGQLLADRQLCFIDGYPASVVGARLIRTGARPEPVRTPDLCLNLLTGRAASGQRPLTSPEMIVPDLDGQTVDAI